MKPQNPGNRAEKPTWWKKSASMHQDELMVRRLSQTIAELIRKGLSSGTHREMTRSERTGLPVAHLGRTITVEDARQLEDDDQ